MKFVLRSKFTSTLFAVGLVFSGLTAQAANLALDDTVEDEITVFHDGNWEFGATSNGTVFPARTSGETTSTGEEATFSGSWISVDPGTNPGSGLIYIVDSNNPDLVKAKIRANWSSVPLGYNDWNKGSINMYVQSSACGEIIEELPEQFKGLGVTEPSGSILIQNLFLNSAASSVTIPSHLSISYSANPNCVQDIEVDLTEYDFGEVELGSPSTMFVNIANTGETALTVSNIYLNDLSQYNPFAVTAPSLPATLSNGQSIDVEVSYNPSLFAAHSGTLIIESDDPDESGIELALSGTGVASDNPSEAVQDILLAIETSVANGTLVGVGNGNSAENKLNAVVNMLNAVGDLIDDENIADAQNQLASICKKVDGQPTPPDMLGGEAVEDIGAVICQMADDISEPVVYGPEDCLSAVSADLTTSDYETVLNMIIEGIAQNKYQAPSSGLEERPEGQYFAIEDDPYPYGVTNPNMWINYLGIQPNDTSGTVSFEIDIFDYEGGPEQPIINYQQQVSDTQAYEKCRGWIDTIPLNW